MRTACGAGVRATLPVILERGDGDLTVQPVTMGASLRIRLQVSGDDRLISGTMQGSAVAEEGVAIEVFGTSAREPALVSGRADTMSVQGMVIGQLTVAGTACSAGSVNWQLTPRATRNN
jgi:hypothetical protein